MAAALPSPGCGSGSTAARATRREWHRDVAQRDGPAQHRECREHGGSLEPWWHHTCIAWGPSGHGGIVSASLGVPQHHTCIPTAAVGQEPWGGPHPGAGLSGFAESGGAQTRTEGLQNRANPPQSGGGGICGAQAVTEATPSVVVARPVALPGSRGQMQRLCLLPGGGGSLPAGTANAALLTPTSPPPAPAAAAARRTPHVPHPPGLAKGRDAPTPAHRAPPRHTACHPSAPCAIPAHRPPPRHTAHHPGTPHASLARHAPSRHTACQPHTPHAIPAHGAPAGHAAPLPDA